MVICILTQDPSKVVTDDVNAPEEISKGMFRSGIPKRQHVHSFPVAQSGARAKARGPTSPGYPSPTGKSGFSGYDNPKQSR